MKKNILKGLNPIIDRNRVRMYIECDDADKAIKKLQKVIERYNSRNEISEVEEIIDDFVDNLSEEIEKIHTELKKEKQSFEAMGITYDEKAFYDILVAIAEKYEFKDAFTEEQYIYIAKDIKKLVSNKSKYTDWTNRQDVKDELYADVAKLLKKNGYPPKTIDDAYDEIMKQVENYKKYASIASANRKKTVDYVMNDGTVVEV